MIKLIVLMMIFFSNISYAIDNFCPIEESNVKVACGNDKISDDKISKENEINHNIKNKDSKQKKESK